MDKSKLYIGTSGYDYDDWKGGFYPPEVKKKDFLQYYSTQFNSLELNGTYYRMPTTAQMQNMITRTEGRIMFTVKAHEDLTHKYTLAEYQKKTGEFKTALETLLTNNLLLCALFQFPESFHYEKEQRLYLDSLMNEVADIPIIVEMRNNKWQNDQVYNTLRQRSIGWCITDNPPLKNLPVLDYIITSPIAYVRFHGRNSNIWYKGNNVTRYDYLYNDSELQSFVGSIKHLLTQSKIVQLFFNNHAKSQATINAKKIEMLLKDNPS
jgi:uncharacterized protein YecE (DUF72 family)